MEETIIEEYTTAQNLAAVLIQEGEPLPLTLLSQLIEEGVIIDEFIATHLNQSDCSPDI